ncbi:GGDEF domain-containing protein [Loktanella sp. S4079]|uniref:GGDEF domain-containing protein n=1 Tax=Loktanella sp. S4079 TaxID=579483 RepID=UPI000A56AEBE|nr:GGDEF domain-containing protein [Loktanella sp. S4079]
MFHPQVLTAIAPRSLWGWLLFMPALTICLAAIVFAQLFLLGHLGMAQHAYGVVAFSLSAVVVGLICLTAGQLRRLQQRVNAVGRSDPLTGLLNRRAFSAAAMRVLPQKGALLVLDIDHLGSINQAHGRSAGDVCLLALAQRCRELTRVTDIIGRLDGASFAIYMPGAPADSASDIADRLADGIQVCSRGQVHEATISVGAVVVRGQPSIEVLLRFAERALNRAKAEGRARVILRGWPKAA